MSGKYIVKPTDIKSVTLEPIEQPRPDWRATLTVDDLTTIADAARYAERWAGMTNNSPLILIHKLAEMLDSK